MAEVPPSVPFPNGEREDDRLCVPIGRDVWLMDDHRWAFYVWAQHALAYPDHVPWALVHIDAHADAVDGFLPDPAAWAELQDETDLDRIYARVAQDTDITLAAFIAPAVRRGWVREVHFWGCPADDDFLDAPLLAASGATQQCHASVADIVSAVAGKRLLLDVDVDVFNRAERRGESRLWPHDEIVACVESWTPLVRQAEVVTIARSFGFSGTPTDTVLLTELVVSRVLAQRP